MVAGGIILIRLTEAGTDEIDIFAQTDFNNKDILNVGAAGNDWTATLLSLQDTANLKIGATTARATTEPTNAVTLFNGTVPVGTLVDGVTFYSKDVTASAEAHVMDEAGNETLLSPHDLQTGEWIFYSRHSVTGRVLKVDMERIVKRLEEHFGWGLSPSRVPGSGVIRGRGSGERETTASSLAGKEESSRKEDNSGQGKDGPAGATAQGGNGR